MLPPLLPQPCGCPHSCLLPTPPHGAVLGRSREMLCSAVLCCAVRPPLGSPALDARTAQLAPGSCTG